MNLPPCCDRCGAPSSLDHALCCRKGGLIIQRHNEICGSIDDLAALVSGWVLSEPVVKDASEDSDAPIGDLGVLCNLPYKHIKSLVFTKYCYKEVESTTCMVN